MSGSNHPTDSYKAPWIHPSAPQLPSARGPNQRTSSADLWQFADIIPPQPQTQYGHISPNLPLQSLLNTVETYGARPGDASISGNVFSRPAHAPLTASRALNPVQGFGNPGPHSQPAYGDRTATTIGEDAGTASSQRPSRRSRTHQTGASQWLQNKAYIEDLYMKQGLPLPEVVRLMERDHNFSAS